VELASSSLAEARGIDEFVINPSRLSDIETKGVVPSIYRIYVLSVIYRADFTELLKLYGVDLGTTAADFAICHPAKTHRLEIAAGQGTVHVPVKLDPGFDQRDTVNFGRMIENWGTLPLRFVEGLSRQKYTYGFIGMEDLTMYPLLLPGCFIQIDEARNRVEDGKWRSEYERPVYFIETRDGYVCSWCSVRKNEIVLQPHPLSPVQPRILKHPQEAEVIGQVVGVAMRLDGWYSSAARERQQSPGSTEGVTKEDRRRSPELSE
jgi:hypothetical protein